MKARVDAEDKETEKKMAKELEPVNAQRFNNCTKYEKMTLSQLPPPGSLEGTIGGEEAVAEIKVRRLRWAERRRERLMENTGSRL